MLTPAQHEQHIIVLERLVAELKANPPPRVCLNCAQWQHGRCVDFGEIPPEHRTTPGCPQWAEQIPF